MGSGLGVFSIPHRASDVVPPRLSEGRKFLWNFRPSLKRTSRHRVPLKNRKNSSLVAEALLAIPYLR